MMMSRQTLVVLGLTACLAAYALSPIAQAVSLGKFLGGGGSSVPAEIAPASPSDKIVALDLNYLGPDEASETSKRWVKRVKELAASMNVPTLNQYGYLKTKEACQGLMPERIGGKWNGIPYRATNSVTSLCNMFITGSISHFITPLTGFATDEQGRLVAMYLYRGSFQSSKGKQANCGYVSGAKTSPYEFGKNPETLVAWEAYNQGLDSISKALECKGLKTTLLGW